MDADCEVTALTRAAVDRGVGRQFAQAQSGIIGCRTAIKEAGQVPACLVDLCGGGWEGAGPGERHGGSGSHRGSSRGVLVLSWKAGSARAGDVQVSPARAG